MESKPAAAAASGGGVLPLDVVFDVLVRLPAKEICRFRAVCRHWRSLTSDPLFIDAHAARHPGPLIVASFHGDREHVHLMDFSGHVVKRLPVAYWRTCFCSPLDLICVETAGAGCSVINPATNAVLRLPDTPPDDNSSSDEELDWGESDWPEGPEYHTSALGRVQSTGEYKVLRISNMEIWAGFESYDEFSSRAYSVLTVNGSRRNRWRHAEPPEGPVDMDNPVVVGGSVYYFLKDQYYYMEEDADFITAYDLETDQWSYIKGPQPTDDDGSSDEDMESNDDEDMESDDDMASRSTLTELNGHLVLVHERGHDSRFFDLWFLIDTKNHVWAKQHSIQAPNSIIPDDETVKPLLLLDDGRIAIFLCHKGVLLLYDPKANIFSEVDTRRLDAVGLYTGSLLSLHSVANV